jgi:hypothetical protein
MTHLDKFNTTVKEFIQDLIQVYPNDSDFQMMKLGVTTAMFTDNTLVQRMFHAKVTIPYETYILQKDEQFFLENSFEELKEEGAVATQLIHKLKNCWVSLDSHNRDMVWKYLRVLILLDKKIQTV